MAITSIGYPGTIMPGVTWATAQYGLGQVYFARGTAHVSVTGSTDGTRHYTIGSGTFGGAGIIDTTTAYTGTLPAVTGAIKYFMICAHRVWATTNTTTFIAIDGGVTSTALPARDNTPGTIDDQPLALLSCNSAGRVELVADLRVVKEYATGVMQAFSPLVLQFMNYNGMQIKIGADLWNNLYPGVGSSRKWVRDPGHTARVALTRTFPTGSGTAGFSFVNAAGTDGMYGITDGNRVDIYVKIRNVSANVTFSSTGGLGDKVIGTVNVANLLPDDTINGIALSMIADNNSNYGCTASYFTDGRLVVQYGTPNVTMRKLASDYTITGLISFTKRTASL